MENLKWELCIRKTLESGGFCLLKDFLSNPFILLPAIF